MRKTTMTTNKTEDIFTRGVGDFIDPGGLFRKKIENDPKNIVIKFGVDPTRPDLHLGHAVILMKLRQFQDLGCKIVFLIGDITAMIGDPTGKSKIRPEVNTEEITKNMKTYLDQVVKILRIEEDVFSWTTNSDWFVSINDIIAPKRHIDISIKNKTHKTDELDGNDILNKAQWWTETRKQKNKIKNYTLITLLSILRNISHGRLVERDMFQNRIKKGEPIFMHEMLYPVIQGIDSDAIFDIYGSCDLEVGGTDQHFNMLMGREVMEMNKKTPQAVLSFKLLEGTDGKEKMSKSLDNYIGITEEAENMYGKVMSIPDSSLCSYFELCTFTPLEEIKEIKNIISKGKVNPKEIKMNLARQIVSIYHGEKKAEEAEKNWENVFSKNEIPTNIEEFFVGEESLLVDILLDKKIISSKSEFRRLVEEGAITNLKTNKKTSSFSDHAKEGVYRIGKKRFCKIIIK